MLRPRPANPGGYDSNGMLRGDFGFQKPSVTDEQYYNALQNRLRNEQTPI